MPTTRFEATITEDRMIRIPDDWDLEMGTHVLVIKQASQPPTEEEADEMLARIDARVAEIGAGRYRETVNGVTFEEFSRFCGRLPKDWKFDREEIHERG